MVFIKSVGDTLSLYALQRYLILFFFIMLLLSLLFIPIIGVFLILVNKDNGVSLTSIKFIALTASIFNLFVSLIIFILFDFSTNQFQFVQEYHEISYFDFFLGIDGLSIYFILLTTIIIPISILSNWTSISKDVETYLIIILLLETLLLAVFLVLDILLFYIFFESILPPLFILIGIFGSDNRVKASFYLFLYTFLEDIQCKRTKLRGSPKALVTKVIKETFLLASLMIEGMVTSLKMIEMKWVIADLNQAKPVKEQRVDGSSKSRNLDFVRCTLVAGKPVLGRKIPFHPDNGKVVSGLFSPKAFIHSTRSTEQNPTLSGQVNNIYYPLEDEKSQVKKLNPWFVTGFVDGEGCFAIGVFVSSEYKRGYRTQAIFKITLKNEDFNLLCQIKDYFGVGSITKHGSTTLEYRVTSLKDLGVILSHFEKYPLISQKWADYELFKSAILLLKSKEHLTKNGFDKILAIKSSMNKGLSEELQLVFPYISSVNRPILLDKNVKDPHWLAGFTSAEGCFLVYLRNCSTTKLGKAISLKFSIAQHSRDTELLEKFITTFECGRIELKLSRSAVYLVVTKFQDITDKIIPFFDKYTIKGVKASDYSDFKKVAMLITKKAHLTDKGISEIKLIKSNMNSLRSSV
jgi:LAGLIDADG DNA endonuclease family protein